MDLRPRAERTLLIGSPAPTLQEREIRLQSFSISRRADLARGRIAVGQALQTDAESNFVHVWLESQTYPRFACRRTSR